MQQETTDLIGAHATYGRAVRAGLAHAQMLLDDIEAAQIIEALYGALVAYSQQVMLRMKAEDPEIGGVDHAFRAGQAYGVSCVLNHLIDQLTDVAGITALVTLFILKFPGVVKRCCVHCCEVFCGKKKKDPKLREAELEAQVPH